ncbi:hypothetical protein JTB14_004476 [Gonioctena quinquepunctata]|nr:hypothetical protein JTB14_004476 [Gonioctena quinquepunctata]
MESRWFLFPGQTLANTKISVRSHALHINAKEWEKITTHLDRKKLIQEAIEKEENKRKYLEEGSKKMIENWENSLENIRKRKEEERLRSIEQKKDERNKKYFELRKEQEKIRKDYVDKMRKQIFMSAGYARGLTSAFLTGEVLYEREKQKSFKEFIKKHEEEVEAKYAETVKQNAAKELQEDQGREEVRRKNKVHAEYLKEMIAENADRKKQEEEERIMKESKDNMKAAKELESIKRKRKEKELEDKNKLNAENKKILKFEEDKKIQIQKEEKELDDVAAIYQEAKHRIECLKKAKERELQQVRVARRDAVALLVTAEVENKQKVEEERMNAAIAERDAIEEAKAKSTEEFEKKMIEERLEDRRKFMEREAAKKLKENELKKWEQLNRYKTDEIMQHCEENKKKEQWKKILEYRKVLLEQMEEDKILKAEEKKMEEYYIPKGDDDDKFFAYADEVLEFAKKKGRSTYPVENAIMQYKKANLLYTPGEEERKNCEDYRTGKKSISKEILQRAMKSRKCRCQLQQRR